MGAGGEWQFFARKYVFLMAEVLIATRLRFPPPRCGASLFGGLPRVNFPFTLSAANPIILAKSSRLPGFRQWAAVFGCAHVMKAAEERSVGVGTFNPSSPKSQHCPIAITPSLLRPSVGGDRLRATSTSGGCWGRFPQGAGRGTGGALAVASPRAFALARAPGWFCDDILYSDRLRDGGPQKRAGKKKNRKT